MSTVAPPTEIAIDREGAQRLGFFTDTTTCIGCKACEVACKQWNDLPADGSEFRKGGSYDHTGELSASTWRHVRFIELLEPSPQLKAEAERALARAAAATCPRSPQRARMKSTSAKRCAGWATGSSCRTSASTAPTPAASTPARRVR